MIGEWEVCVWEREKNKERSENRERRREKEKRREKEVTKEEIKERNRRRKLS